MRTRTLRFLLAAVGSAFLFQFRLNAHCDTVQGPVVADARQALESGKLDPVLKWIRAEQEVEIRDAFKHVLEVRKIAAAAPLAERWFFETVVRVHRAAEGAPYTGLKDTKVDPLIAHADRAVEEKRLEPLLREFSQAMETGLHARLHKLLELSKYKDHNVKSGREYVAAYVDFMHYAEGVHAAAIRAQAEPDSHAPSHKDAHAH